jgi:hypothetical protein
MSKSPPFSTKPMCDSGFAYEDWKTLVPCFVAQNIINESVRGLEDFHFGTLCDTISEMYSRNSQYANDFQKCGYTFRIKMGYMNMHQVFKNNKYFGLSRL